MSSISSASATVRTTIGSPRQSIASWRALQFPACGGQPLRYIRRVVAVLRSFDLVEEGSVYEGITERSDGRKQLSGSGRPAPGSGGGPPLHPLVADTLPLRSRRLEHRRPIQQRGCDEARAPGHQ